MNFESLQRDFFLNPTTMGAKKLINELKRNSMKLPVSHEEIFEFVGESINRTKIYLLAMDYGNPSDAALRMYYRELMNIEDAMEIVENDKIGCCNSAAIYLYDDDEFVTQEWVKKVIENSLERVEFRNLVLSLYNFTLNESDEIDEAWIINMISRHKEENKKKIALLLWKEGFISLYWFKSIVGKSLSLGKEV